MQSEDILAPSKARVALLTEAIRRSADSQRSCTEEFVKLPAIRLIKEKLKERGYGEKDPLNLWIEICAIFDLRNREAIVLLAALLEKNEAVHAENVAITQDCMQRINSLHSCSEVIEAKLEYFEEQVVTLGKLFEEYLKLHPRLIREINGASKLINDRSLLNTILNVVTPLISIFVGAMASLGMQWIYKHYYMH